MTVLQHLEELRSRAVKAGIALILTTGLSFVFTVQLIDFFTAPIGGRAALSSIEVTENISVFVRVALLAGLALGLPFVLYQIIAYIAPGLTRRERRWLYLFIPAATIFFLTGAAFAWFVMIPVAVPFLIDFLGIPTQPRPLNYIGFIATLLFWIGISFEMPLVVFFLAKLKWVTAGQLLRGWRYAFVGIAAAAAAVTPTADPINMGLTMVPLLTLYFISIVLARIA
jgi:sec-independent protein translocase protein TatC